jgi:hypothetical protein
MAKFELYMIDLFHEQKVSIDYTEVNHLDTKEGIEIVFYSMEDNNEIIHSIYFDKSTAIKFAKTLRTEINKIQE